VGIVKDIFPHIADQYPPEIRRQKYQYWQRLIQANKDYRDQHDHGKDSEGEKAGFEQWMRDQWGLEIGMASEGITPYYIVVDQNKYLLFLLKYDT
jgi:hypothetical protein